MRVTADACEAAYDFLRAISPFKGWALPPGDDIEFHITRFDHVADCSIVPTEDGAIRIRISEKCHEHLTTLLMSMAHEMIHVYLVRQGKPISHNAEFMKIGRRLCRQFGWDAGQF
jgi:hypothetical protein